MPFDFSPYLSPDSEAFHLGFFFLPFFLFFFSLTFFIFLFLALTAPPSRGGETSRSH
ncbi:uncharacterized protein BO80DRAFT_175666 [Aspergillus ibericus CBS 121593]|uniref:Uncharacterized protein n=1 Tax=Aspergillus ibericus CBS 121593 TaxID=1448316 RepID=A0A395HC61_9EURO|nr:hypothetical protein BO80DRAFT_175666 [Aspergillus ibericus CBS 121593]RAL05069.1 hypothetical protein BO80DRAFT_175666 [Aspergillus ibericus CBS 121593]